MEFGFLISPVHIYPCRADSLGVIEYPNGGFYGPLLFHYLRHASTQSPGSET